MIKQRVLISEVYEGLYDGPHATPPTSDKGAVFLGISNITKNGHIDFSNIKYISEEDLPKWTKRVTPRAGDIVFSYEATLNLYAIIPENFWGCLGRRMALIRPDESKALGKYLYYYFFSDEWRATIAKNTVTGATVDRIPIAKFPEFPISLPSLEIQKRIVDILSAYDYLIENNQKQIKLLEEAAQRLYKEWFVNLHFPGYEDMQIVDGVPEGWKIVSLDDVISKITTGLNPRKNFVLGKGNNFYVTIKNMGDNNIYLDDKCDKIDNEALEKINKRSDLRTGDILFSGIGTMGRVYLISIPTNNWNVSESVFTMRANERITNVRLMDEGYSDVITAMKFGMPYVVKRTVRPYDTATLNYNWQVWNTKAYSLYTSTTSRIDKKSAGQAVLSILRFCKSVGFVKYQENGDHPSIVISDKELISVRTAKSGIFEPLVKVGDSVDEGTPSC